MNNFVISVKNVTKTVANRQLLTNVTFDIEPQSLISIIGPNGAGKSILVKIVLGLDKHYTGTVTIKPKERVRYLPQFPTADQYQLPMSVHEYISIGATPLFSRSREPIDFEKTLTHVGVSVDKLHQSYISLSGGERQRVAIARTLLGEPTILVLDEPLAAVDYASREELYKLIRHLQQNHNMTVLLISHDIESVLPLSDRVLCLDKTLHTNCHPSEFVAKDGRSPATIHHHHF